MYALCNQVSIVIALWKEGVVSGGICGGGIGVVGRQRLLDLRSFARRGFLVAAVEEAHRGFGKERGEAMDANACFGCKGGML